MPNSGTIAKSLLFLLALVLFASPGAVLAGEKRGGHGYHNPERSDAYVQWHRPAGQKPDDVNWRYKLDQGALALIFGNRMRRHDSDQFSRRHHSHHGKGHHAHYGKGHRAHHGKGHHAHHGKGHHAHHGKGHHAHHGKGRHAHHGKGHHAHHGKGYRADGVRWRKGHHAVVHHGRGRACHQVTDIGYRRGHKALLGGTACYDRHGNYYIVDGSRYVIGYLY